MIRPFAISLAALSLLSASICSADEPNSVVHNEPITVRILSGRNGQPLAYSHLILIAGYDQGQIRDQLWREETLTDAQGQARLSKQLANLPWLQVWVDKKPLCQSNPRKTSFSVERIFRDGLSAPNRCGTATVENVPGVFTVFVRTGKKDTLAKSAVVNAPAPEAVPATPAPHLPAIAVAAALPVKAASTPRAAAPRADSVDLSNLAAFSFPASVPVVVSAGSPAKAAARRPARRVVARKAKQHLHRARPMPIACKEQKPAKPAAVKASAKTASKPANGAKPTAQVTLPKQK